MKKSNLLKKNPFTVSTPERLSAQDIVDLFVPYPEFGNLESSGHQFLNGHRGSGKSMMLRMLLNRKTAFQAACACRWSR